MTVEDIMRRDLVTAAPADRLVDVGHMMRLGRLRHLPVVRDGILVGVLSYRDLADACFAVGNGGSPRAVLRKPVVSLVKRAPITIEPERTLAEAVLRMLALHVGCLPVATPTSDGPRLVGVVTEADLLRAAYLA